MAVFNVIAPYYPLKTPLTPLPPLCAANACASKHVVRSLHNIYQPSLASATKIKFLGKFKKTSLKKTTTTNVSLLWVQQIWIPLSAEESKKVLTLASVFKLNQDSRQIWRTLIFIFDFLGWIIIQLCFSIYILWVKAFLILHLYLIKVENNNLVKF